MLNLIIIWIKWCFSGFSITKQLSYTFPRLCSLKGSHSVQSTLKKYYDPPPSRQSIFINYLEILLHLANLLHLLIHSIIYVSMDSWTLAVISSVQLLSCVRLFATPWTVARQASWSLPKLMSIESVMPSNHLILCHPLLLLPSIFPNIRIFSNESALRISWPKYWSWNSNILASWCEELTHLKRSWCWESLKAGGEGDDRGWDGWMASLTRWILVWVSSRS